MLSFEQAPPVSATFRFLLTAPWFGVAAGLLLAWVGPEALASRWTPAALALTHLITVGFMLQAMCGAMLQFLPVATGANVWRPRLLASLVHPALIAGALTLTWSLASAQAELLPASELLLGGGLGAFCAVTGAALIRTDATGVSLPALRAAIAGLAATTVLGLLLARALSGHPVMELQALVNLHAAWGLGGWALALLAGVSFAVVPMFQMTPSYPRWLTLLLPATVSVALITATFAVFMPHKTGSWILAIVPGVLAAIGFALVTLRLQQRRRRARIDASLAFSRGAMIALALAALGWLGSIAFPGLAEMPRMSTGLGILCLVGVFVSAINGMLYKIVPFVGWLKLPDSAGASLTAPSIKMFISERAMAAQMRMHFVALAMLLASLAVPQLARLAGLAFAVSCAWLGTNLLGGLRVFLNFRGQSRAAAATHGS